jgi:hypothetical protein
MKPFVTFAMSFPLFSHGCERFLVRILVSSHAFVEVIITG